MQVVLLWYIWGIHRELKGEWGSECRYHYGVYMGNA